MGQGTDAIRMLSVLALGVVCCGCANRRQASLPADATGAPAHARVRAAEPSGPVAVGEPRPAGTPPIVPTTAFLTTQNSPPPNPTPPPPPQLKPTSGPALTPPSPTDPPGDALTNVRRLLRTTNERYAGIDSYIARLRRREMVGGKMNPDEMLAFKFRKQPWSVHFKWLSDPGKGREVLYVKGQHNNHLHTLLATGDIPLIRGGMRMSLAPNDPRVLARCRYPITDAGIGAVIQQLNTTLNAQEKGETRMGTLTYAGFQTRPDYLTPEGQPASLEAIELSIPPNTDSGVPHGGRRLFLFDPANGLPVLVSTKDHKGHEVEYYCYDRLILNVRLDDDDFNPDKLWRKHESAK